MLIHALANKENTTKFKLLYSNISEKDILLRAELDALKAESDGRKWDLYDGLLQTVKFGDSGSKLL